MMKGALHWRRLWPPLAVIALLIAAWWAAVVRTDSAIFPTPWQVVAGTLELAEDGTLWEHIGASLFRVGTGFGLAALIAVPLGLWMGWVDGAYRTLNPIFQMLRPISPIAWMRKRFAATDGSPLPVIDEVSFAVADGEIVGPSGCGKSTLLNIVAGFERPDAGSVRVDGAPQERPSPKGIVISQHGSIFPWLTVRQNLMFGLNGQERGAKVALADRYGAMVGLTGFEHAYPHELSGGMLKRAELARALVAKPDILYMDEPFSALDALIGLRMRSELLRVLGEERHTVLLITHDVEEAIQLADRVLVLAPRPTRIQAAFDVDLPRARRLSSPQAQALREAILKELGL